MPQEILSAAHFYPSPGRFHRPTGPLSSDLTIDRGGRYFSGRLSDERREESAMEERTVIHQTFTIERRYRVRPERIFSAFADPATKRRWFAESETNETETFEMDFRVGGGERARYRFKAGTPFPGAILTNQTSYLDIVSDMRIVIAYTMTIDDRRFSASLATFEFIPADDGTNLIFTEQGAYFEGSDGPQIRQHGWRKLLDQLATVLSD